MTVKKTLSHVASAVVLGAVLMLTTFLLFPSEVGIRDASEQWSTPLAERAQELKGFSKPIVSTRVDLTPVVFMMVFGVACALGVTLYFKKKTI